MILQYDYNFSELDISKLKVMEYERAYRLKPNEEFSKKETLIGVYMRRVSIPINIIGSVEPTNIYKGALPFEPWLGLKVTFPLCG